MTFFRCFLVAAVCGLVACGGRARQVESKPIADFKFTQSTARPQVFIFDAAESRTTVGSIAKYRWLFGDEAAGGATTDATTASITHAYKMAGTFTVTLVVADDKDSASDPVTKTVMVATVDTTGPMAMISGPTTGQPSMMLTFDGSASTPTADIQTYAWDFGDGITAAGKDKAIVQHAFATASRFRVTLTVTDSLGQSNTAELQVAVGDVGPLAVCSWSPNMPYQGSAVMFNGSMSTAPTGSSIVVYQWDFGDGQTGGGAMTQHTYAGAGPYTPKLTVYDNHNPIRTNTATCSQITLGVPPLCTGDYSFTANPNMQMKCGGNQRWAGVSLTVTQMAGGTITSNEVFGTQMITYTGTWSGSTFMMSGSYDTTQTDPLLGTIHFHTDVVINGSWTNGCMTWTGTYHEHTVDTDFGVIDCMLDWNVTGTHL